ncbi:MAG: LysM peptidoglycan-binding domain-containing protein [Chitinophagales bacterium]
MLHHVACAGQTLGGLAKAYGCKAAELAGINGFAEEEPLSAGVVIWIPVSEPAASPGFAPEVAPPSPGPELETGPVLRLPSTIFAALRRHAQRHGTGRLVLTVRSAGEGEATHLHFSERPQS